MTHPHSYARWNTTNNRLVWCLLASHNLSMAAWGKLDKSGKKFRADFVFCSCFPGLGGWGGRVAVVRLVTVQIV